MILTGGVQIERHDEPHDGENRQVHDAGDAEEEARQAVVYAGGVSSEPAVAPGGRHGERVHGDGCSQVCYRQIHTQQLRGFQPRRPFVRHDDDQEVSNDGENG